MSLRILLTTMILFCLAGCASGLKRTSVFYADVSLYDVLCENQTSPKKNSHVLDSVIVDRSRSGTTLQNGRGERTIVPTKSCIFERLEKIKERPENLTDRKLYQVVCKIGEIQFMDSHLQIIDQDVNLNYMRKTDGRVWLLPKKLCPLIEQSADLGD